MEIKKFPNKLKSYRLRKRLSQKAAAKLLGHKDTVKLSRWENGHACPSLNHLIRLALIYGVHPFLLYPELYKRIESEVNSIYEKQQPNTKDDTFFL